METGMINRNTPATLPLLKARLVDSAEEVLVDDIPCRLGLLVTYNPLHYDQANDRFWHDDELEFLDPRNQ